MTRSVQPEAGDDHSLDAPLTRWPAWQWCRPRRPGHRPARAALTIRALDRGHLEPLRARCLAGLLRGEAGVQGDRREHDAAGDQRRHQRVGERPSGRSHLGAARSGAEDGLVGVEGIAPVEIAVGDRPTDSRPAHRPGRRAPAPATAGCPPRWARTASPAGHGSAASAAPRRPHDVPGRGVEDARAASGAERSSTTRSPPSSRAATCSTTRPPCMRRVDLAGHRRGVVHDEHVTGAQVLGQVPEPGVGDARRRAHQQADLVPRQTAGLRRSRCEVRGLEVHSGRLTERGHQKSPAR